jgi:phosphonate transport system permease protein
VSASTGRPFEERAAAPDVDALRRTRPRSRMVRISLVCLAALVVYAWLSGDIGYDDMFSARRAENMERFLSTDARPFELRNEPFSLERHVDWAWNLATDRGFEGALATLAIAVMAMALAGLAGAILSLFAARNVVSARPFEPPATNAPRGNTWRALGWLARVALVFLRSIPEYIWAYVLLAMLGTSAWPAILALAIHNAGILGKLGAETVENLESKSLFALRQLGATRAEVVVAGVFPLSLSRYLLYVFYRFETCVREATVLGLLGVVSLGYWIQDARARQYYDQMILFVLLGSLIVLVADLFSALVRARLRRAA